MKAASYSLKKWSGMAILEKIYLAMLAIWVLGFAATIDQQIVHIVEAEESRTGL